MVFILASIILTSVMAPASATEPLVARPGDSKAMRLHIGDTGIRCVRLPCPARGVFVPTPGADMRDHLLYSDSDGASPPPPMVGQASRLAAVSQAWHERRCIAVDGRLISGEDDRPVLRIDRIVGACRDSHD